MTPLHRAPLIARVRARLAMLALVLVPLSLGALSSVARAEPPLAEWEKQVVQLTSEQDALLKEAKLRQNVASVVSKYQSRVGRDPSAIHRYLLGRALYWNGDPVGAKSQMEQVLQEDPKFYFAHTRLGMLFKDLKNYAEAEKHVRATLAVKPGDREAVTLMAEISVLQKDWDRALRYLNDLLSKDPADIGTRVVIAQVHSQRGNWEAAGREWKILKERVPAEPQFRHYYAVSLYKQGAVDLALAELEAAVKDQPGNLSALTMQRAIYAERKDLDKVRATTERMLPYLQPEEKKQAQDLLEELKNGPSCDPRYARPQVIRWEEFFEQARKGDKTARERALQSILEGCQMAYVKQVPGPLLQGITSDVEPEATCRALLVRILGLLPPTVLPLVGVALYDEDTNVRMLAAETIGDMGSPGGIAYLLPFVSYAGIDVVEYQAVREALSQLTGFSDLPAGVKSVTTAEEVIASREAWRRWRVSDDSTAMKVHAIQGLVAVKEPAPERYLYDFVLDPSFDVMKAAYVALRDAVSRPPADPVEKKSFPRFPVIETTAVTRIEMTTIQKRVEAWWTDWVAERRAYLRAKGGSK